MAQWLLLAVIFYTLAQVITLAQAQTVLFKLGNVTLAAFVGFWIDRHAFRKAITDTSTDMEYIRRAIIIAAAMLAISLGL